jgi:hypothetical protein
VTQDDDFAHRELCPDGACLGLVGPDGRCKVCHMISPSSVRDPRLAALAAPIAPTPNPGPGAAEDDAFDDRVLCADGACTGVVGADGRCKVCGLRPDGAGIG